MAESHEVVQKGYLCSADAICDADCELLLQKFRDEYRKSTWQARHPTLGDHYKKFHCKRAVEIGIARGELGYYFLKHLPQITEYYGVDPFLGGYDSSDIFSRILEKFNSTNWAHAILKKMSRFDNCRFRLFHNISRNIIDHFPANSVDCVFIDGDHTYRGVQSDISAWFPKVRIGGYLTFDDVTDFFPGTKQAVHEFVEKNKAYLTLVQINELGNYYFEKTADVDKIHFW